MIKSISLFFLVATLLCTSCKKEGCTDALAFNFNSDATKDDGSCIITTGLFIGVYDAAQECEDTPSVNNNQLTIASDMDSAFPSRMFLDSEELPMVEARSSGLSDPPRLLVFDRQTINIPNLGEIDVIGEGRLDGEVLTIDYSRYYTISGAEEIENCTIIATKN